jgi:hypothetical protein
MDRAILWYLHAVLDADRHKVALYCIALYCISHDGYASACSELCGTMEIGCSLVSKYKIGLGAERVTVGFRCEEDKGYRSLPQRQDTRTNRFTLCMKPLFI